MNKSPDTLFLVDGSGFIFRAFYALPDMTRADGTHVNAVFGFCKMLQKLLDESGSPHIAVIFDAARKTFRNEIYPDYKAHRPPPPPELVPQFALIREATRAFGLPALEAENYEADDLIATYARQAVDAGWDVKIVSSDKDLMQLIREGVSLYDPMKAIPIEKAEVLAKFGVTPDKVVDILALAGDASDNVPGVPGIGVKTAAQLIEEFGSLENLLEKAHTIKQPKRRALLTDHADLARLSKRLVVLNDHAPVPMALDDLHPRQMDKDILRAFLESMGFKSILARMDGETAKTPAQKPSTPVATPTPVVQETSVSNDLLTAPQDYECVQDVERLRWWAQAAKEKGVVAVDTETDSLTPSTCNIVGLSLAIAPGKACYVPLGHVDPESAKDGGSLFDTKPAPRQLKISQVADTLRDLFADPSVLKIAHNLKFDSQVFAQHDLNIVSYDDTMLMSYVLAAGLHGHGLDELALLFFQHKMIAYDEVTGTGRQRVTFDRVPLDKATPYAAEDADFTLRLWLHLKPQLAQQHLTRVYERIERPLVPVIAEMETTGVKIDAATLREQSQFLTQRMAALETEIHALAGHPFNIGSPKQLGDVLFGELGLEGGSKSKTGAYQTGVDILEPLAEQGHEIVAKILDWRALSKLKSTYTDALPEQISPKTGRVHTSFSMVGAATGRLSSTDPNLQNIPIRTEDGRAIRRAFVAAEGCELLSVDYSQIELRLAAEIAGIEALQQAFRDGRDIHALTASQVFGIPLDQVSSEKRRQAKAVNFGIIYGISGFGLAKQLGCTPGEANTFIRQYLDRFHELRTWIDTTKDFAHAHGYVETLFGRRIHVAGINDKNAARRNFAERQAINAPLQGTAADIMKRAMIRVPPALKENGLSAKLLLQVHDELVLEVPTKEMEATAALVKKVMEEAPLPSVSLKVPLVAEAGHALTWADAH